MTQFDLLPEGERAHSLKKTPGPIFTRSRLALLAALIATGLGLLLVGVAERHIEPVIEWVRHLGAWGPVVAGALYVPAAVLLIPGTILTLGIGYLFGVLWGAVIVVAGQALGVSTAFFLARYLARDWVAKRISRNPKYARLDRALGEKGFRVVLLSRLAFLLPYNVLNYFFGLSSVPYWKYLPASLLGMLPESLLFLYLASAARSLHEALSGINPASPLSEAMFIVGLAALLAVIVVLARIARQALNQSIADAPAGENIARPEPIVGGPGEGAS